MSTNYKQQAHELLANGFEPLPEFLGSGASIKGWNTIPITSKLIKSFAFDSLAIRLTNKIIAIDVDTRDISLQEKIREILPKDAPEKFGTKGFTMFFKTETPLKSENFKSNGELAIELLSTGRKTSIGIHRSTGKPYQWHKPLESYHSLPTLANTHLEALRIAFPKPAYKPRNHTPLDFTPDLEEIEKALSFVDSTDRDTWISIGRSLYSFDSSAFQIFDSWSSNCPSYKAKDTSNVWNSFKNTSSTTIATLFWHAKQGGYIRMQEPDKLEYLNRHFPMFDKPMRKKEEELILPPPSLLLDITNWITDTGARRNPMLSLPAAIAFVGVLLAHKVQSTSGIRSNIYTAAIGHSATGKEHPRKCVSKLMYHAGMIDSLGEKPASGTGVLCAVEDGGMKFLFQTDEFGMFLEALSGGKKQGTGHVIEIKSSIMSLFSASDGIYHGKSQARSQAGKKQPAIKLIQPCLCMHGSTTPSTFYDSIGAGDTVDGFLNRWLLFINEDPSPERQKRSAGYAVPDDIRMQIDIITEKYKRGFGFDIDPEIIPFSPEAEELAEAFDFEVDDARVAGTKTTPKTDASWGRCWEIAIKLALIASAGKSEITKDAMQWGIDVSKRNSERMVDIIINEVYENQHQQVRQKIIKFIKTKKLVSHSIAVKHFGRDFKADIFKEFIRDLQECGEIDIINKDGEPIVGRQAGYYRIKNT